MLLSSIGFDALDDSGFLSPTFRCKAFDASADGYARGEGCGAVVLMRLEDALEANCRIEAVIRGTASIHNGTATHFAAPSPAAQYKLIHRALSDAGVQAEDVCYVETHGTGTRHGDPIEFQALKSVFGKQRERPLVLGAIKTNIGHLEGAAGIAGLIKTILVLQRRA
ncbi:MAG: polyketide synthase, partial [Hyphomicrobiales bacterium]|nr:polyketide synthase [Hyphomicrobiales bacterium]